MRLNLFLTQLQYSKRDDADRCLAAAIGATDPAHARDSGGSCIYLGSRALHVTRAVDREEVREAQQQHYRTVEVCVTGYILERTLFPRRITVFDYAPTTVNIAVEN